MRFKSAVTSGFQIFAVTGTNTVSFAIDATATARKKLLGFSVKRYDPEENDSRFLRGYKVFRSLIPDPDESTDVSTFVHPVQSFVWDDFTAKPGRRYVYGFVPFRGTPRQPVRGEPISIEVDTEPLSAGAHDVFFNRGVASSQAYAKRFHNRPPELQPTPEKQAEARAWLTRDLLGGMLAFIDGAAAGDALHGAFYEFRYRPVADALIKAIGRGVDVRLIVDAKVNEYTDKAGKFHPSFPREDNLALLAESKFPMARVLLRTARASSIAHNKFMVLLRGAGHQPAAVWTGSTNLSEGGLFGQTNVGHHVRVASVAAAYRDYWKILATDPGGRKGDAAAAVKKKNAELRKQVEALSPLPQAADQIAHGVTPIFSPRGSLDALGLYAHLLDRARHVGCMTLAFGINKAFKQQLSDNKTARNALTLLLLEKQDKRKKGDTGFIVLNAKNNVYQAWGAYLKDPFHQWVRETSTGALRLNTHVMYIHSKFLLQDPLGKDPIIVGGSANFSEDSTTESDENMVAIRGDTRAADIYFTEFNRIFQHYYFRSVHEAVKAGTDTPDATVFLAETDSWLSKYAPGTFRSKRIAAYRAMHVPGG